MTKQGADVEVEKSIITLYLLPGFDQELLPIRASRNKDWWQDNFKTRNHAQHCLPLAMANSLGYYILSPAHFTVSWDGDVQQDAHVQIPNGQLSGQVDNHAAFGSFTVQPGFIPMTSRVGDFVYIKGIANQRSQPFQCMEALIEAWWNPAPFGLVFLLNQPGTFTVEKGEPLAQMFIYRGDGGSATVHVVDGVPDEYESWRQKRYRVGYAKDLDYLRGRHPDGRSEPTHRSSWTRRDGVLNEPSTVNKGTR
jgi:hypothetical protein